jgi:hypothetical protein
LFLQEQQLAAEAVGARAQTQERLPELQPTHLVQQQEPLSSHLRQEQADWKQVGWRQADWPGLPQAVMLPVLDRMTFCTRKRAVLPTATW